MSKSAKTLFRFLLFIPFLSITGCKDDYLDIEELNNQGKKIPIQEAKAAFAQNKNNSSKLKVFPDWNTFKQEGENAFGEPTATVKVIVDNEKEIKASILFFTYRKKIDYKLLLLSEEEKPFQVVVFNSKGKFEYAYEANEDGVSFTFYVLNYRNKLSKNTEKGIVSMLNGSFSSRTCHKGKEKVIIDLEPIVVHPNRPISPPTHFPEFPRDFIPFPYNPIDISPTNPNNLGDKKKVTYDDSFKNSQVECRHHWMLNREGNNAYKKMFNRFNDLTHKNLNYKIGNLGNQEYGVTRADTNKKDSYTVTFDSKNVENNSDLMKTVVLFHELVHAYMFDILRESGAIEFDNNGDAVSKRPVNMDCNHTNIPLNKQTMAERFNTFICALKQLPIEKQEQWTHELFNDKNVFEVESYRKQLENFIRNYHDWNHETPEFRNEAENIFGNNWKDGVSEAASWIGLDKTREYNNFMNKLQSDRKFSQHLYNNLIREKLKKARKEICK